MGDGSTVLSGAFFASGLKPLPSMPSLSELSSSACLREDPCEKGTEH